MRALIGLSLLLAGCGHNCKRGHYETQDVPESLQVVIVPTDGTGGTVSFPIIIPAHAEKVWVCDEAKKASP